MKAKTVIAGAAAAVVLLVGAGAADAASSGFGVKLSVNTAAQSGRHVVGAGTLTRAPRALPGQTTVFGAVGLYRAASSTAPSQLIASANWRLDPGQRVKRKIVVASCRRSSRALWFVVARATVVRDGRVIGRLDAKSPVSTGLRCR